MRNYIAAALCLILLMILSASMADEASHETQQLKELEKDRDRIKQEKDSVLAREKSVLMELKKIGKDLAAREKELRIYRLNLLRCERDIKELKESMAEAELRLERTRSLMSKRLKAMYKFGYQGGQLSYLKLLLDAESISDMASKYKYMSAIAASDRKLLDKAMAEKAEVEEKKKQMEDRKKRILNYKAVAEKTRKAILNKRRSRQDTLGNLQRSEASLNKTLAELEMAVGEKGNLIQRLRSRSTEESYEDLTDLGKQRGRLPWPVAGKVVKNSASSMQGVTIQAGYGANIRCVANGIVEYAQWFDGVGFGQMVIVDHGNGYRTLYAHASELLVRKGDRVKAGHVIARVGDTGSLRGSILYFEIWEGTKAMQTRRWLK